MDRLGQFLEHKSLVFGIAYRMTGSVTDAEDIVQESFLRWEKSGSTEIRSPKAFLSTIATRLSLDTLRKVKNKRETYIGPWLPEPIPTSPEMEEPDPETLDLAFLHLLEKLNPIERAVFILRESFDVDYKIIAEAVGKTQENCRQTLKRAKDSLKSERKKYSPDKETKRKLLHNFLLASAKGQPELLLPFLKEEIVLWSDGGGKVHAARIPLFGKERVASFLIRTSRNPIFIETEFYYAESNGAESLLVYKDGKPVYLRSFLMDENGIKSIYTMLNDDKLQAFANKRELLDKKIIVPLEFFLLFPKSSIQNPTPPIWTKPLLKLVHWAITRKK
ncbi:sigma-70 family RNA polymerase sigma factor [Leptospira kmetyi]|uniref:RNA polymerase subunit sigma n=1 Tax=Leptospira kmetyi TaxID=408139 RepID=A0ABX4N3D3_9LEPT|nr:sigma-70 family RNA polymerase sigma factor [Leptospira kmetyi]EQA51858.1 sigma-70 region 2 [Leptospira kmetyi serovar Malaysia str. Bejo-Iso9]PJZ27791.1 RNA polymerase subunit sigma [Leptospira kmetyi]PJZ40309.1 RNA polymerase subunit sigma [Leptospira kmetyi]TGK18316.1 sigma-70 family RNA polymerase sigma factor [Leptospira kmetyi]TGK26698.1 sigma-70 family RNA polymerase sigma factor [Leptospira kmetyi]